MGDGAAEPAIEDGGAAGLRGMIALIARLERSETMAGHRDDDVVKVGRVGPEQVSPQAAHAVPAGDHPPGVKLVEDVGHEAREREEQGVVDRAIDEGQVVLALLRNVANAPVMSTANAGGGGLGDEEEDSTTEPCLYRQHIVLGEAAPLPAPVQPDE